MAIDIVARGLALIAQAAATAAGGALKAVNNLSDILSVNTAAKNLQGDYILAKNAASGMSVTGTLTETTLATITVPAGAMGANGHIEIDVIFSGTPNANSKTYRVKFGSMVVYGLLGATTSPMVRAKLIIYNRNNVSSQISQNNALAFGLNITSAAHTTGSENTANAVTMLITGQLSNTGDTITLEAYSVRVFPQA